MNSRERVINALEFKDVDRLPRHLWFLPGIPMFRQDELDEVSSRFPDDIVCTAGCLGKGKRSRGTPGQAGAYTDAWGAVWHSGEPGVIGEVKEYIFSDWSALKSYRPPYELLDQADMSKANRQCEHRDKFVLGGVFGGGETRPFERMQFLRGTENVFMDLAYGTAEILKLRDMLHEFFVREFEMWAKTDVDGISFMDDWGSQQALLISPEMWREYFKPLYRDYCDIAHSGGKYVFMHSDGNIEAIYPDLIEIGVDALNSQLFCMDIEKLGEQYAGKITFWGEIDRQKLLPFGSPEDVKQGVRRVAEALMNGRKSGVIAQCEWGVADPKENIEAIFTEWDRY